MAACDACGRENAAVSLVIMVFRLVSSPSFETQQVTIWHIYISVTHCVYAAPQSTTKCYPKRVVICLNKTYAQDCSTASQRNFAKMISHAVSEKVLQELNDFRAVSYK
jgi:hypothetical protein